jgi:hypothetical protein
VAHFVVAGDLLDVGGIDVERFHAQRREAADIEAAVDVAQPVETIRVVLVAAEVVADNRTDIDLPETQRGNPYVVDALEGDARRCEGIVAVAIIFRDDQRVADETVLVRSFIIGLEPREATDGKAPAASENTLSASAGAIWSAAMAEKGARADVARSARVQNLIKVAVLDFCNAPGPSWHTRMGIDPRGDVNPWSRTCRQGGVDSGRHATPPTVGVGGSAARSTPGCLLQTGHLASLKRWER